MNCIFDSSAQLWLRSSFFVLSFFLSLKYVGVPDGMGSYLVDDDTVRIVVQSESYGQLYYESYPYFVNQDARRLGVGSKGGASFTGSHVQYVDLDRESLSTFMTHSGPASDMIKGFGQVADTYYNLAGDLVGPRAANISHASARPHYSNTDVNGIWAVAGEPSEADWLMQSLCSAHLEEAHQWGPGLGLEDDIYITNEEWITCECMEWLRLSGKSFFLTIAIALMTHRCTWC